MPDQAVHGPDDPRVAAITEIFARETGIAADRLQPDATIEALGIPSLDMVQAIFAIESYFDVEIPVVADRAGSPEFSTVGDLLAHILATIDAKQNSSCRRLTRGGRPRRRTASPSPASAPSRRWATPRRRSGRPCRPGNAASGRSPTSRPSACQRAPPPRSTGLILPPISTGGGCRCWTARRSWRWSPGARRWPTPEQRPGISRQNAPASCWALPSGRRPSNSSYLTFYGEGINRVPPLTVPRIMPSSGASHVSMEFGIRGPVFSTASACASATHAIGQAFQMVRAGMLDLAVTGGGDASIVVGFMKGWEALRVLSPDVCRPFSRDRAGLVIGEGAGMMVLEPLERARARGATVHAELVGCGMSADAADLTAPDARGAAAAMRAALDDAGLRPEQVGYINAHGTGTRLNDRTETAAIAEVFGGATAGRLAVSSSKSMLGHCMSACGAVELVLTILAVRDGVLPPTVGFRERDPDCDIDCVPNVSRAMQVEVALSNSFAFGGLNAVLAVRRSA